MGYMTQYAGQGGQGQGDYSKYMSGGGQGGGDYSKFMQQYAGKYMNNAPAPGNVHNAPGPAPRHAPAPAPVPAPTTTMSEVQKLQQELQEAMEHPTIAPILAEVARAPAGISSWRFTFCAAAGLCLPAACAFLKATRRAARLQTLEE